MTRLAALGHTYVVLIETKLQSKVLSLVKSIFGPLEVHVPQLEIVCGQHGLHFRILLDGLELLLESLRHAGRHLL